LCSEERKKQRFALKSFSKEAAMRNTLIQVQDELFPFSIPDTDMRLEGREYFHIKRGLALEKMKGKTRTKFESHDMISFFN
jgi:hypothetical protein